MWSCLWGEIRRIWGRVLGGEIVIRLDCMKYILIKKTLAATKYMSMKSKKKKNPKEVGKGRWLRNPVKDSPLSGYRLCHFASVTYNLRTSLKVGGANE